jgi:hypothetical protein
MYNIVGRVRIGRAYPPTKIPSADLQVTLLHCTAQGPQRSGPEAPDQVHRQAGKAKLLLSDHNHMRTVQPWTKVNGELQVTTKQQAVRPWLKIDATGRLVVPIKIGSKPIEFEKSNRRINRNDDVGAARPHVRCQFWQSNRDRSRRTPRQFSDCRFRDTQVPTGHPGKFVVATAFARCHDGYAIDVLGSCNV